MEVERVWLMLCEGRCSARTVRLANECFGRARDTVAASLVRNPRLTARGMLTQHNPRPGAPRSKRGLKTGWTRLGRTLGPPRFPRRPVKKPLCIVSWPADDCLQTGHLSPPSLPSCVSTRLRCGSTLQAYFLMKPSDFGQGFRPNGSDRERKLYGRKMPLDPRSALVQ